MTRRRVRMLAFVGIAIAAGSACYYVSVLIQPPRKPPSATASRKASPSSTSHQTNLAQPSRPKFSLDTPVEAIAADRRGKAVLDRDVPGLTSDPHYVLIEGMSLRQIATISGGQLTSSMLDQVQADFDRLAAADP
jgi:hypothetical protein